VLTHRLPPRLPPFFIHTHTSPSFTHPLPCVAQRYGGKWRDADPALVAANLAAGVPHTIRFRVVPGSKVVIDDVVRGIISWDADATVGDFILLRSSGIPVYNFCVACDDALMGVTTVVRAEEHLTNTLRQGLVLDSLGVPRPEYAHCSLILGEDRQKLSKRHGATSCDQFRKDGFLPDAMINYLSLLGWNDGTDVEIFSRDELVGEPPRSPHASASPQLTNTPPQKRSTCLAWFRPRPSSTCPSCSG